MEFLVKFSLIYLYLCYNVLYSIDYREEYSFLGTEFNFLYYENTATFFFNRRKLTFLISQNFIVIPDMYTDLHRKVVTKLYESYRFRLFLHFIREILHSGKHIFNHTMILKFSHLAYT